MRKIYLAALFCIASMTAFTQANINQGDWMLGGNISFSSTKQGSNSNTQFTQFQAAPDIGYFFINNLTGGLRVNYISLKPKNEDASSHISVAPFLRYYFLPSTQKVNVFLDAHYGFGSVKFPNLIGGGTTTDNLNEYGANAGVALFLTPVAALEFALGYASRGGDYYEVNGDRENEINFNIGFQIHLPGSGVKK